jgi:hypothetical protein
VKGHVEGPLVRGQKVRVVLDGRVEHSHEGWEMYCDGAWTLALDSEAIVSIQFIDEPVISAADLLSRRCPSRAPGKERSCWRDSGHADMHSSGDGLNKVEWT